MLIVCPVGSQLGEHGPVCVMRYCGAWCWGEIVGSGVKVVESQLKLGTLLA